MIWSLMMRIGNWSELEAELRNGHSVNVDLAL